MRLNNRQEGAGAGLGVTEMCSTGWKPCVGTKFEEIDIDDAGREKVPREIVGDVMTALDNFRFMRRKGLLSSDLILGSRNFCMTAQNTETKTKFPPFFHVAFFSFLSMP